MADLAQRRPALETSVEGFRRVSGQSLTLQALPPECHLTLRGDPRDTRLAAAIANVLGVALPLQVGMVSGSEPRVLALGPDEWLIVAPDGARASLVERLDAGLAGLHHALIDVSASRAVIEVQGPRARDLLAKGMTLDLHPRVFAPPRCASTLMARVGVILEQTDGAPTYRLYVRASFAAFLASWLVDAAEELAGATPAKS